MACPRVGLVLTPGLLLSPCPPCTWPEQGLGSWRGVNHRELAGYSLCLWLPSAKHRQEARPSAIRREGSCRRSHGEAGLGRES